MLLEIRQLLPGKHKLLPENTHCYWGNQLLSSVSALFVTTFELLHSNFHLLYHHTSTSPASAIHLTTQFHCLCTFPPIFQFFKWSFLYFSSRCKPCIHTFLLSLYVYIHISIFHVTIFVLLQPALSIYPSIFTVFPLFHLCSSLSNGHFCTFPAGVIHIHTFLLYLHFSIHISIFHVTIFVFLQPAASIYPCIFTVFALFHPYFNNSNVCLCSFPPLYQSIFTIFTFSHPYIHFSCGHLGTSPASAIHLSIHFHRIFTFPFVFQSL